MFKRFAISHNKQVWIIYGVLVAIVLVGMAFITRSSLLIDSSRQAAETEAVKSRFHSENLKTSSSALRWLDQNLAGFLISFSKQFDRNAESGPPQDSEISFQKNYPFGDQRFFNRCFFSVDSSKKFRIRTTQLNLTPSERNQLKSQLEGMFPAEKWMPHIPPVLPGSEDYWSIETHEIYHINKKVNSAPVISSQNFPTNSDLKRFEFDNKSQAAKPSSSRATAGPVIPFWIESKLLIVRRYRLDRENWFECSWIDWQALKRFLEGHIRSKAELNAVSASREFGFPDSAEVQLRPVIQLLPQNSADQFFSSWIPLQLLIGFQPRSIPEFPTDSGHLMLIFGWFCVVVTAIAVGLLLRTVLRIGSHREAFASAVTHELRTPLTTFKLYADLLATNPTAEKTKIYAETLQGEAERLGHLVENVLCYSRVEKRGITSHHRVTVVKDLVDSVTSRIQDHCQKRDAFFDTEIIDSSIYDLEILTDPNAVERILLNLADNACKYGKTDEGTIIDLKIQKDRHWLILEIQDQGPGLAGPQKKRLFKAYNHATISTDSPYTSVGLGLAICYRLAKALGGKLTYSDNQPGCNFRLYLPLQH